jgi:hypothetical protein
MLKTRFIVKDGGYSIELKGKGFAWIANWVHFEVA